MAHQPEAETNLSEQQAIRQGVDRLHRMVYVSLVGGSVTPEIANLIRARTLTADHFPAKE